MRHSRWLAQMIGFVLVLVLAAACASTAPTPTGSPPSAPTATVVPTQEPTETAAPPPEPQAGATRVVEPSGITLVYVPGGEFTMGSALEDSIAYVYEKPAHTVYVDGFWIGQTELTNAQYGLFMEAGGYSAREYWTEEGWQWKEDNGITGPGKWDDELFNAPQQPVGVTWYEAAAFAAWVGGRLPTEAEWEYAARGGPLSKGYLYAGSDNPDEVAWYGVPIVTEGHTEPVGQKQPNELGLYDMSGNSEEWCADWYDEEYYAASPWDNPQGPESGERRSARGGWFGGSVARARCESRVGFVPAVRGGMRVVVAPPATAQADQAARNKEVMHTFIGLFQSGKWDDFDQVIASDCVLHYPGGVDVVGLEAMKAGWQVFYGALKNLSATPLAEISEGDILIDFLTFEVAYEGEYLGHPISGVPIKYNQVEMARIANGKIVEWWVEMDRLWMSEQLGFELSPK